MKARLNLFAYGCLAAAIWFFCAVRISGNEVHELIIDTLPFTVDGRLGSAVAVNGSVPGPVLRLREGQEAVIRVTNRLNQVASIHWHGVLVPPGMDGVPGVSFTGIQPKSTFTYRFRVRQGGTYWAHAHDTTELVGLYFPLIIDPLEPDTFTYDRDHVVMLSDWSFEPPGKILSNLKKMPGYYNFQKRTIGELSRDAGRNGIWATLSDRLLWAKMRMSPTDFADVTGYTYHYLMNGRSPSANWTGIFRPGERVRLRFIDAGAMTYFDVRIPGLKMTVVQADGQNVKPVEVEEFRIAPGETYDVIVEPKDSVYTIFAETLDRSGYARGTLATSEGMSAPLPERRARPLRTMADMGMDMRGMKSNEQKEGMEDKGTMQMEGSTVRHGPDTHGPGNSVIPEVVRSRLDEPGTGLENAGRVLVYSDLESITPRTDERKPVQEVELHLTGNMERYTWSFNGKTYAEAQAPVSIKYGERVRLILVNDTMMEHPIHPHGMFMELENGRGAYLPRKHTINVKPAERLSLLIAPDEPGPWAFHCHLILHMEAGMFRVIEVSSKPSETPRRYTGENQPPRALWPYPIADKAKYSLVFVDLLEYQRVGDVDGLRWNLFSWHGGDYRRLWLKSEGQLYSRSGGEYDLQVLYGKLVTPFFDFQTGVRFEEHREISSNPQRVFAVVGLQGLTPYTIEIEPSLFLSNTGTLSARFTAQTAVLLTQRLVLQPRFEMELSANKDEEFGVNAGFNDIEAGVRLQYEIRRELAPYMGVSYRQSYDIVRERVESEGGAPNRIQLVAGVRAWF